MLVQHVVVLDVGPHGQRGGVLAAVEEDRGAGHPVQRRRHGRAAASMNSCSGPSSCSRWRVTSSRPRCQVVSTVNATRPMSSGSHAPCDELGQVGGEEQQVDGEQDAAAPAARARAACATDAGDVEEQQGGDGDRAGHGHAVGVGQRGRAPEGEHQREHRDQQQPVDPRDVDLADLLFRGVLRCAAAAGSRAGRPAGRPRRRR